MITYDQVLMVGSCVDEVQGGEALVRSRCQAMAEAAQEPRRQAKSSRQRIAIIIPEPGSYKHAKQITLEVISAKACKAYR